MDDAMVTSRMPPEKKEAGSRVLEKAGLNASQAINLLYDRLEAEQNADFLIHRKAEKREWESAAVFLDAIASPVPIETRFDTMTRGEIKHERAKAKGLM